jgi:hypothetical protein
VSKASTFDSFVRRNVESRKDAEVEGKLDEADQRSHNLMEALRRVLDQGLDDALEKALVWGDYPPDGEE